jgi:hypothetical protein
MRNDDRLLRAVAEGVIVLLNGSHGHPARDNVINEASRNIRNLLNPPEGFCDRCDNYGYYYAGHVDGGTAVASSITKCDCDHEAPKWVDKEIERWKR